MSIENVVNIQNQHFKAMLHFGNFLKKLVSCSSGQQQEEEEGVAGNTIENRNTNMRRVFVFILVFVYFMCVFVFVIVYVLSFHVYLYLYLYFRRCSLIFFNSNFSYLCSGNISTLSDHGNHLLQWWTPFNSSKWQINMRNLVIFKRFPKKTSKNGSSLGGGTSVVTLCRARSGFHMHEKCPNTFSYTCTIWW